MRLSVGSKDYQPELAYAPARVGRWMSGSCEVASVGSRRAGDLGGGGLWSRFEAWY